MSALLEDGDLDGARRLLPSLCGRDPAVLDAAGLTRAAVESIAENTSDAQVAPLWWAAVAGVPGVLVYRGANTLDAMIGHRSPRYARFGWAAARLDDVLNYRLPGWPVVLVALCAPVVGGSPVAAVRAWRRDARGIPARTPAWSEAAFAGALGVRLGGPTQYAHELEIRPTLGDGRIPEVADVGTGGAAVAGGSGRCRGAGGGASAPPAVAVGDLLFGGERRRRRRRGGRRRGTAFSDGAAGVSEYTK